MVVPGIETLELLFERYGRAFRRGESFAVRDKLIVVLGGTALATPNAEGHGAAGERSLGPGDIAGEEVLLDEPLALTVHALSDLRLLAIPSAQVIEVFRGSPGFALHLTCQLYARTAGKPMPIAARPGIAPPAPKVRTVSKVSAAQAKADTTYLTPFSFNEEWFFADQTECPACSTPFRHLRVRTRAIVATTRDSDFHYHYKTVNPLHYAIIVCPRCRFAGFGDDFSKLRPSEADAIVAHTERRLAEWPRTSGQGERDASAVRESYDIALECYRDREDTGKRTGGVLHRLAWLAREAGDAATELAYLKEALAEFRRAYEGDRRLSARDAVNLSYIIAELSLRAGRYDEAIRWFGVLEGLDESKKHREILRLVRERRGDAAEAMRAGRDRVA